MDSEYVARAVRALDAGEPAAAVEVLVAQWRGTKAPALADVIDALSAMAAQRHGPVKGSTRAARMTAWDDAFSKASPGELGALFDALPTFALADARERWGMIKEKVGTDPRVATWLLRLAFKPPTGWHGAASVNFWRNVLWGLDRLHDVRVAAQLPQLLEHWRRDRSHSVGRFMIEELPHLIAKAASWQAPAFDEGSLEPLKARLGAAPTSGARASRNRTAALASVYADPFDLGRRRVLADALIEEGDVRGELIALQLIAASGSQTAAQRTRQSELLKQFGRVWLGPLDDVIQQSGLRYERGFPVAAVVGPKTEARLVEVIGLPEWATFEELDCERCPGDVTALVTHESMRSLKVLHGARASLFASKRPLLLEEISFRGGIVPDEAATVFGSPCVPRLRRLRVRLYARNGDTTAPDSETWRPYWASPVMKQLEELTVTSPSHAARDWFELVQHAPPNLQRVAIEATSSEPWAIRFDRAPSGWNAALRYGWDSQLTEDDYRRLDEYLRPVKVNLERVVFDFNRAKVPPTDAERSAISACLRRSLGARQVDFLEPGKRPRAGRR